MENSHGSYTIIDEPKAKAMESLILSPLIILMVSIFFPIFWTPPAMGQYWLPFLWIVCNGYFLGSATLKKEVLASVVGGLVMIAQLVGLGVYAGLDNPTFSMEQLGPYVRIGLNGTLFLTLYYVVFTQSTSYELYEYMKGER